MLSVIIPTLNADRELGRTFNSLLTALVDGMVREVIIVDANSTDKTRELAEAAGATILTSDPNRGKQMHKGALQAKSDWLLFLHADTALEEGWHHKIESFIAERGAKKQAAAFKFALDDTGFAPKLLTLLVSARSKFFKLPYGDQGLLISNTHYNEIGGFRDLPLMEDVDIIGRMKHPVKILNTKAITSAARFKRDGYLKRSLKNLQCLGAYYRGKPIQEIKQLYEQ